ncbi:MAG TPA: site-2 protease family protein [Virgibacillus sp.]|nr:site-2 protease family protein [Virgibacillus sp.]
MNLNLLLFLIFIVAPIGTVIHELGHVIGASLVKSDRIMLSIGTGKKLGTISLKNVDISIHTLFFLGGYTYYERKDTYQSNELIWMTILGPISSCLFAYIFYYCYQVAPNSYFKLLFLFNAWLTIVNIVPFKFRRKSSDGYIIVKLLTNKHKI